MYIQKNGANIEMLLVKKWIHSKELRLPNDIMEHIRIHTEDKRKIIEEVNGHKRLIIKLITLENELTNEQLFENYTSERNHAKIQNLDEAVENEK